MAGALPGWRVLFVSDIAAFIETKRQPSVDGCLNFVCCVPWDQTWEATRGVT
jgi:hypothetical protein